MSSLRIIWAKLPELLPEFTTDQALIGAYHDGRIDQSELQRLTAALKRRNKRYATDQGYPLDDDEPGKRGTYW